MFASKVELENGLSEVRNSPRDQGLIELIVCRPTTGERRVLDEAELDVQLGLLGDNWLSRGYRKTPDGSSHPDMQINIMNSRCISIIAKSRERWKLAGDQFYVDLNLSKENMPPGTILSLGSARLQVTSEPHLGCKKFLERFGKDAVLFVNSEEGKLLNLRGINARVIQSGKVSVGGKIQKCSH